MQKVTILRGLPASGKSTWAKEQVKKSNGRVKRVSKDLIREMLDFGHYHSENEEVVKSIQYSIIQNILWMGNDVIIDDTNLNPNTLDKLHSYLVSLRVAMNMDQFNELIIELKDFDTDLVTCIKRNADRGFKVPQTVIVDMYNKYIKEDDDVQS